MASANDFRYDPAGSPRDRLLRVGDKEREAVSEILRRAHVEGRLDEDEFQSRLDHCLKARTYADLDMLIGDLPGEAAGPRPAGQRPWRPWPVPVMLLPLAVIAAIAIGVHAPWVAIPLLFFFVVRPLVWRAWGGPVRGPWACGRGTRVP